MKGSSMRLNKYYPNRNALCRLSRHVFYSADEETGAGNTQRVFEMMGELVLRPARKTLLKNISSRSHSHQHPYNFRLTPKSLLAERV